ncbi:QoxB, Quinol oxidase subunit II [Limoniibacter endophyticus]|uniref:Cytochrome aa3 subunit 2 n=2 Tax=Limoniibacter endophyticus TaxID=1565040 RepID=A0A8J3DJ45_9HYPH|nr:QoxB, Quinol oxidase subunit II [Limoniibacter endophyticus]
MLAGSVFLFLLVMTLFFVVTRKGAMMKRVSARSWIIGGGLVLPLPILIALTGYALYQGERLIGTHDDRTPMRIEARGRMWTWDFHYPDLPGISATANVLHIPAGQPIEILLTSSDVIHSFWVPRLGGKIDAIPGHVTRLRIEAGRPGSYGGVCAEYCGAGHAGMDFRVIAHDAEEFERIMSGNIR